MPSWFDLRSLDEKGPEDVTGEEREDVAGEGPGDVAGGEPEDVAGGHQRTWRVGVFYRCYDSQVCHLPYVHCLVHCIYRSSLTSSFHLAYI